MDAHTQTKTINKYGKESTMARFIRKLEIPPGILAQHVPQGLIAFCTDALVWEYERLGGTGQAEGINTDDICNGLGRRDDVSLVMKGRVSMRLTFGAKF